MQSGQGMAGHNMQGMSGMQGMGAMRDMSNMPPMQRDLMMAMHKMDQNMMAADDSQPDRAWAKKMIAHHEGAIAMSEIELRNGQDAGSKQIARKTMMENRKSIGEIRAWLAKH